MIGIRLAVLDLAGTTVRDDGAVEAAFVAALDDVGVGPDTDGFAARLAALRVPNDAPRDHGLDDG